MARMKFLSASTLFLGLCFLPVGASANCPDDLENDNFQSSVIDCIKALKDQIRKLGGDADSLGTESSTELVLVRIPRGMVAAFDLPNGCPRGWSEYSAAGGRVIIGAGATTDARGDTRIVEFNESKGEFRHSLSMKEMPTHYHSVDGAFTGASNQRGTGGQDPYGHTGINTSPAGENDPHNNMPPYIALYFCKKD